MVFGLSTPADEGLFVTPGRERKQTPFGPLAFEPLVVDEAVDGLEPRLEVLRELEIIAPALRLRLNRKDDCKHGSFLCFPL
jgi:hypothetical protein